MSSLRWRLILWLWLALISVGLGFSAFSYWQQRNEADALLDYQMEQIAGFLAAPAFVSSITPAVAPQVPVDHDIDDDLSVTVRSESGAVLYASQPSAPLPVVTWVGFRTVSLSGRSYRLYSGRSGDRHILIAQQTETRREVGRDAVMAALQPLLVLVPLLGLIIAAVIGRQLRPLRTAAADIARRPALALSPLPASNLPAEVRPLVEEINRLLIRLREAIDHERRFVSDAAHALRTPLTALQLQADVLDGDADPQQRAERLTELRAGIRRTARLTHHLLALARSESDSVSLNTSTDVDAALEEIADNYRALASSGGISLVMEACANAAIGMAKQDFTLVVGNLVDNALRYTPRNSTVLLRARSDHERTVVEVIDEGPGLPETELMRVMDRFYRAPGDKTEGSGLGLAIVKGLVEKVQGVVRIENRTDRSGLLVQLTLPRATGSFHSNVER